MRFIEYLSEGTRFPDIEQKIEEYRKAGSPRVRELLALLSQAERALDRGESEKAERYHRMALAEELEREDEIA